ncbi:hypothetical protein OS188_13790 [Xanthomarina sp. F1114]|uniref:hypothetical protein n=1 Tax=Xanthomarina sp. F1114 TaxID=2996019 RepID=UPI00225E58C6|nr:hypothetical protein [Xanthomarina sp. F1114]MCX7549023.1 hypothetical protein [Xanthomarina sp. F1114]
MRLVAIFIKEHEFLFNDPVTLNFGGEYNYDFSSVGKKVYVQRSKNENYISGFFDQTNLKSRIESISSVVGKNGTGKSSILDVVRSFFIRNQYGLPYSWTVAIFEKNGVDLPFVLHSDFENVEYRFNIYELEKLGNYHVLTKELDRINKNDVQSIYYSPHFDYKYNLNFDEIDIYDISFDKILEQDLEDLENKDANANGWSYSPSQELIFKNSIRQLMFLSSSLVRENQIFKNIFELPEHGEAKLFFRGHVKKDPWNTPNAFRWPLKAIKEKLEDELNKWHEIRLFDKEHNVTNQIEINKYLVKRYLIRDIISVLERQMEKNNSYLSEGKISIEGLDKKIEESDVFNSFLFFIEHCIIKYGKSSWNAFDFKSISSLLNALYKDIDEIETEKLVQNDNIQIAPSKVVNILNLHRNFLLNLFNYYPKIKSKNKEEELFDKSNRIEGFINYIPTSKKLSSGENAMLNLFSRFYDFINNNLVESSKFLSKKNHYIILLDEADLAFHPSWKRKFVKSIISTIPYFFSDLLGSPSLQVIFTTHDPLTLSDIPQSNVIYLDKDEEGNTFVNHNKVQSFGANVHDLLANSFFLENGFMGEFAEGMIKSLINHLTNEELGDTNSAISFDWNKKTIQKFINTVDEPFIKERLTNLFDEKYLLNDKQALLDKRDEIDARLKELNDEED